MRRYRTAAERRLKRLRQGTILAVGFTGILLLLGGDPDATSAATPAPTAPQVVDDPGAPAQEEPTEGAAATQEPGGESGDTALDPTLDTASADPAESARRATGTLRQLGRDAYNLLPVVGIALGLLLVAGILARLVGVALRAVLASWERAQATAALASIFIWLLALGAALSVLAGDARALVGSIGLFGLALSWALQAPIESFSGWLLNSFRSYYRVGDRIGVGEVFGDVARIDFLTTTVFEAGGAQKRVQAAQSTGALVTFPNSEVLRANIINYTRDFPYVWDELTVGVANESDIRLAVQVLERTANELIGERMADAAREYARLLELAHLGWDVTIHPEVFVSPQDAWTDLTIRYLVPAREMRTWATRLLLATNDALAEPDVARRVFTSYPRSQVQHIPPPRWTGHAAEARSPDERAGRGGEHGGEEEA